jgi:hypothetical protein
LQKNSDLEISRNRKKAAEAKSYDSLDKSQAELDEDEEWERKQKEGDFDPDEVRRSTPSSVVSQVLHLLTN